MAQSLKMNMVETGTFKELFAKAKTGSVIEFGKQEDSDGFIANSLGRYFTHGNSFFVVTMDGERRSLGSHEWDRWMVCEKGLFFAQGKTIFAVHEDGSEIPLHTSNFAFDGWTGWAVSSLCLYFPNVNGFVLMHNDGGIRKLVIPRFQHFAANDHGIYLRDGHEFFFMDAQQGEVKSLGEHRWGKWAVGALGLFIECHGELKLLHIDGRTLDLGSIYGEWYESPYGVFTTKYRELFLHVIK